MKPYLSHIDPDKLIYPGTWVVSLVAKSKGQNPEHAFLIVEGLTEDWKTVCFRRYDYVVANPGEASYLKSSEGYVVIKEELLAREEYDDDAQNRVFWNSLINDSGQQEGCHGASWNLSVEPYIYMLHSAVQQDKITPPLYQISGKNSMLSASVRQSGDNCYTWARQKLKDLNHPNINHDTRLKTYISDFFAARTTRHLFPPGVEPISPSCCMM